MDNNKKNILVVNLSNPSRKKHFQELKKYGINFILMMEDPTWELDYADMYFKANVRDIDECVKKAKEINEKIHIDGVISIVEHAVPTAAAIAKELNLTYISTETAYKARNKFEMKEAYTRHGIKVARYELISNLDEAKKFTDEIGYPIVLKPIIGGGSICVLKINSENELIKSFENLKKEIKDIYSCDSIYKETIDKYGEKIILIEEYIDGIEMSVESVNYNGKTDVLAIHEKEMFSEINIFPEAFFCTPASFSDNIQKNIIETTIKSNKALGINFGLTHTEYRLTKDNELYIIETGARMGGGPIFESVLNSTGVNMMHALIDISMGKKPEYIKNIKQKVVASYLYYSLINQDSKIVDMHFENLENVINNPNLIKLYLYRRPGDIIKKSHQTMSHSHMSVTGKTREEAIALTHELAKFFDFELEPL